jgi:hypothetical protein
MLVVAAELLMLDSEMMLVRYSERRSHEIGRSDESSD